MDNSKEKISIAKNIYSIEAIKVNILAGITRIYDSLNKGREDLAFDYIAAVIVTLFRLAKKLGYTYRKLDERIAEKVKHMDMENSSESKEDILELKEYLTVRGE